MPAEDISKHNMMILSQEQRELATLKEFLIGIINERERKYESRFASIDRALADGTQAIKDALAIATANTREALGTAMSNTKEALGTANANIATALASLDKRFEAVNEFRAQLADQQEILARKVDVDALFASFKEAALKTETATEKRFDSVNEFRAQMGDQQRLFIPRNEVDIRFRALDEKLDAAVIQLERNRGRDTGIGSIITILLSAIAIAVALVAIFLKH